MRTYRRLQVRLSVGDRRQINKLLQGGLQAVRVVLRSLALSHLHEGKSASEVAAIVRLTSKAVREIGRRYEAGGLERALYDKQRPGAAGLLKQPEQQRIIAMT
jgi:putative transposase